MPRAQNPSPKKSFNPAKLAIYGSLTDITKSGGKHGTVDNLGKPQTKT